MTLHKDSMAAKIRNYKKDNPFATTKQIAEATGATLHRISNVLSNARIKAGVYKRRKRNTTTKKVFATVGVNLNGGYYSLEKLTEIVKALETLNKLSERVAQKTNHE